MWLFEKSSQVRFQLSMGAEISENQKGNITLLLAVICAATFSLYILSNDSESTRSRSKEIKVNRVVNDAQQMNLAAISYLSTMLEKDAHGVAALKIIDKQIIGNGNAFLSVDAGKANYKNLQASLLNSTMMQGAMTGHPPLPVTGNHSLTSLEILDQSQDPTFDIYDVRATTSVAVSKSRRPSRPVNTVARIKVAIQPPCDGYSMNNFCYFYGASGESCDTACSNHSRVYDDPGTDALSASDASCNQVLDHFGAPAGPISATRVHLIPIDMGCKYYNGAWVPTSRYNLTAANGSGSYAGGYRACACKTP